MERKPRLSLPLFHGECEESVMRTYKYQKGTILMFLVPALSFYILFFAVPLLQVLFESLFYWKGLKTGASPKFVGFANYVYLFKSDPYFWKSFFNTVYYMIGNILIQIPAGFILAYILYSGIKGKRFFNVVFFMPYVLSTTSVALMWRFIFHPEGLLNRILDGVGLSALKHSWLADPSTNMSALVAVGAWQGIGLVMILFYAGLTGIPGEIIEAAEIDGSKGVSRIIKVIIPMLWTEFITIVMLVIISSVKVFDSVWILTRGGPFHSSEVLTSWMLQQGMILGQPARGSAIASFIFIFVMLLGIIMKRISGKG